MSNKEYNEQLRAEVADYLQKHNISQTKFAKKANYDNPTALNLWLSKKPVGNVTKLEARINTTLQALKRGETAELGYIDTNVTTRLATYFKAVQKSGQIALIDGPAGIGKSVGSRMFLANPNGTAIGVPLLSWSRGPSHIIRTIQNSVGAINDIADSGRLIIFDNCQRLTRAGVDCIMDLHDETRCPMALVGNPEILRLIQKNDQHFSRVGIQRSVKLDRPSIAKAAAHLATQILPEHSRALKTLAANAAAEKGHLRRLRTILDNTRQFISRDTPPAAAFAIAEGLMVREEAA